jgi:hypothetical protein
MGHFSNGTAGVPSQFSMTHGNGVKRHKNVLVYIDNLLVHTASHEHHLEVLEKVFEWLHKNHLKVNLEKCVFGNQEVSYLGFTLTPKGIKPGRNKLQAIKDAKPPTTIKMVRSFVGLCNFFRTHIKDLPPFLLRSLKLPEKTQATNQGLYDQMRSTLSKYCNNNLLRIR